MADSRNNLLTARDALDLADRSQRTHSKSGPSSKVAESIQQGKASGEAIADSDGVKMLVDGVNTLLNGLPSLVRALDELGKLHPFVSIAVGAFKVVIELEMKRRDNDKKVNLLFLEMRDMMATLLQLQTIRSDHVARDGVSIGTRLQELLQTTAEDITQCANVCDTYSKKRLLVKVLKGSFWDDKLKEYISRFTNRRVEINHAIVVHTGLGVESANEKLDSLDVKMNLVLEYFRQAVSHQERRLKALVESGGGEEAIMEKPDILADLLRAERNYEQPLAFVPAAGQSLPSLAPYAEVGRRRTSSQTYGGYSRSTEAALQRRRAASSSYDYSTAATRAEFSAYYGAGGGRKPSMNYASIPGSPAAGGANGDTDLMAELVLLRQELLDPPALAIQKNFLSFERKFKMQHKELIQTMQQIVVHEGDRVIKSVLGGPHERIIDQVLYEIWRDMRWRGIVKARHLVLAIHDYYMQQLDEMNENALDGLQTTGGIDESDTWTMAYIDLLHLQSITEAFDGDASGFITIAEVNSFTTSRPKGWSLMKWLAFWAIGWQSVVTSYRRKFYGLFKKITAMVSLVRFENQRWLSGYLSDLRSLLPSFGMSFQEAPSHNAVLSRFADYTEAEERRLLEGLETAKYDIDGLDTLALIIGPKGIERNLFQLLYLLLRRHVEIMEVAKTQLLHQDEMRDASASLYTISGALQYRCSELSALFSSRRLDPQQEFAVYACGMFDAPNFNGFSYPVSDETDPDAQDESQSYERSSAEVTRYPPRQTEFYAWDPSPLTQEELDLPDGPLKKILGPWNMKTSYEVDGEYLLPTTAVNWLDFHILPSNAQRFVAHPPYDLPWFVTETDVLGEYTWTADGSLLYTFRADYSSPMLSSEYFRVTPNEDGTVLRGHMSISPDFPTGSSFPVTLKRLPAELMLFQPYPRHLGNKTAALWRHALDASLYLARQRLFSWSLLKERRDKKRRFASLCYNTHYSGASVKHELNLVLSTTSPYDVHCWAYIAMNPGKYPWILPSCIVCNILPVSSSPFLRCLTCTPIPPLVGGGICPDSTCLERHTEVWSPHEMRHAVVKAPSVEWQYPKNYPAVEHLLTRADAVWRGERPPQHEEPHARRRLSTIEEIDEEDQEISNTMDGSALPPIVEDRDMLSLASSSDGNDDTLGSEVNGSATVAENNEDSSEPSASRPGPPCVGCEIPVTTPCWLCLVCDDSTFICTECESRGGGAVGYHSSAHALVRFNLTLEALTVPIRPGPMPVYSDPALVEMKERLTAVEGRLSRIESLLESAIVLLGGKVEALVELEEPTGDQMTD